MIYEYECCKCGKIIEIITNDYDKEFIVCDCGYVAKRIMSKNTFKLRGVGWSNDNYDSAEVKANVERNKKENERV